MLAKEFQTKINNAFTGELEKEAKGLYSYKFFEELQSSGLVLIRTRSGKYWELEDVTIEIATFYDRNESVPFLKLRQGKRADLND